MRRISGPGEFRQQPGQLPCDPAATGQQPANSARSEFPHQVAEHRGERAERQPVGPEFQALAGQYPAARRTRARRELGHQPGLADPGLATDKQRGRAAALADRLKGGIQSGQLCRPPDEDGTRAAAAAA